MRPLCFNFTQGFGQKLTGRRFLGSRRNEGSSARNKGSGAISFHAKPEEVLGNLLSKYNTLTKEIQITTCIEHIELWKQLMLDAEILDREETTEVQSKKLLEALSLHEIQWDLIRQLHEEELAVTSAMPGL